MRRINTAINNEESDDDQNINASAQSAGVANSIFGNQLREPLLMQSVSLIQSNMKNEIMTTVGQYFAYGDLQFFTKESENSADNFFQNIMYKVHLSQLYSIVDTCFYSQNMPFCPILVEGIYEGCPWQYQLQVWDKNGQIVYQKDLKSKLKAWCVTNQFLVYLPEQEDQADQSENCFYIVYLYKDNATIKLNIQGLEFLEEIENPILGFCNKCLYISQNNHIYIMDANELPPNETINDFIDNSRQIKKIDLGPVKNHAFLMLRDRNETHNKIDRNYIIICCETPDNQVDFARLYFYPNTPNMDYKIEQIGEVLSRQRAQIDPIVKFKIIYDNSPGQWPFAITLRRSGQVDFYWNYQLVEANKTLQNKMLFSDIDIDFNGFYLLEKGGNETLYKVKHDPNGRVGLDEAKRMLQSEGDVVKFDQLFQMKLINHVNFYSSQCMVGTSFFTTHNNIVFIYDLKQEEVVNHICLDSSISKIFRVEITEGTYRICIILQNGIKFLENQDSQYMNPQDWKLKTYSDKLFGTPIQFACNNQYPDLLYIMSKNQDKFALQCLAKGSKIINIDNQLNSHLTQDTIIFPLQTPSQQSRLIVFNRQNDSGKVYIVSQLQTETSIRFRLDRSIPFQTDKFGKDVIHGAVSLNIDEYIFLFGRKHIYKLNVEEQTIDVIPNCRIASVQMIDQRYCYAIVQKNIRCNLTQHSGIKLFSVQCLIDTNKLMLFDIEPTIVARNSQIDFSEDNQRLIYTKNYEAVHIIPPLHRTTINFIGMLPRERYLAVKKIRNRFFALDKNNTITVWNALTGKIDDQQKIEGTDYSKYTLYGYDKRKNKDMTYAREWNQPRSLIVSKEEAKDGINSEYLENRGLLNSIAGCQAYINQQDNQIQFRKFIYIEIMDEKNVKVHLQFVHQYFRDKVQRIYISDDCSIMIEKLINLRVVVYQNIDTEWKIKKRFYEFPHELQDKSQYLYLFSPNLKRYLTFDNTIKQLVIKNTLSEDESELVTLIPQLRNINTEEEAHDSIRRFRWIDNCRFLVTSEWGFEKLFEISDLQEVLEISSSQIPAFNMLTDLNQIYFESDSLSIGDVQNRLLRKHRHLKRLRFLSGMEEHSKMYDILFSVDYNVNHGLGKYVADISFSYLHWKVIREIELGHVGLRIFENDLIAQLCLNILPGCKTLLHYLNKKSQEVQYLTTNVPLKSIDFEMPFIYDLQGKTPLHYCVESQDFKTADIFIKYLAQAPLDHHSREIKDILPILMKNDLPSLLIYFDKRMQQTDQIKHIERGCIKSFSNTIECGMMNASQWEDERVIANGLFQEFDEDGVRQLESEISLKFIDLPNYHILNTIESQDFFEALKDSDNLQLFELKSIRLMIEFMWPQAKYYTQWKLFYPFIGYLVSFWIYTNIVDEMRDKPQFGYSFVPWIILLLILVLFSLYFLRNEMKQISTQKFDYFKEPWNYIDLAPPIAVLTISAINALRIETDWELTFMSIGSLLMWLKLLYFCRINKFTGYLIRMIMKVVFGMRTFLSVLLITILAVADAFVSIQVDSDQSDPQEFWPFVFKCFDRFFLSVFTTYSMILGGDAFEVREQHTFLKYVLVIFCTLFVMIVMLNLLISIIGDIFGKVQENQINEYYQEKASIIAENCYLIPQCQRGTAKPGQLLLVACKAGFQIESSDDDYQNQINRDLRDKEDLIKKIENAIEKKLEAKKEQVAQQSMIMNSQTTNMRNTQLGRQ